MMFKFFRLPTVTPETLIVGTALWLSATANLPFWRGMLDGRDFALPATWGFVLATGLILVALHFALAALLAAHHLLKPVLCTLLMGAACASYYASHYGTVMDPSMIRNVLATDQREAAELLSLGFLLHLAGLGAVPAYVVWRVSLTPRTWRRALMARLASVSVALVIGMGALWLVFQDFSSLMRNHKALRYTITPANLVWSLSTVALQQSALAQAPRLPADPAERLPSPPSRRPTVLIMVVGETARAANWGLQGYARQTTPALSQRDVISFTRTEACGTSTEVSVPCMFSPYGRADYDEDLIRRTDSILHVLDRAGVAVLWRDNQSGCKGVCNGLPFEDVSRATVPTLCSDGRCFDEILLHGLDQQLTQTQHDSVVVLHMLGNHGPSYYRRYPAAFAHWQPACASDELRNCPREAIVNAYDNAIRYTDHVLAQTIDLLQAHAQRLNVALLYVSDHGESLGERGLYLHGIPYSVAPREQLEVPMFWWFHPASAVNLGIDVTCLRQRAQQAASHDTLYHSLAGLLSVRTPRYVAERDVFAGCRRDVTSMAWSEQSDR